MTISFKRLFLITAISTLMFIMAGCGGDDKSDNSVKSGNRDNTPVVLDTSASGKEHYSNDIVDLDVSNSSDGYSMLKYTGKSEKVKLIISAPNGIDYTYLVTSNDDYEVYPLPGGSGEYNFNLYEIASPKENLYAVAFSQLVKVEIKDEFAPFLHPNFYVNFSKDSKTVAKGAELSKGCADDIGVIQNVYNYVIENVKYDEEKAENVKYGYTPDVDETLETNKGICFDYASLMSAMLRSQRIPTKLEVGYVNEVYHAWISCYVKEKGWIDNIIQFDGKNWSLMDPTLAADNDKESVKEYIGDGSSYLTKYTY